jgi:hypothetical protein
MQETTLRSLLSPLGKKRNRRDEIVVFGVQYKTTQFKGQGVACLFERYYKSCGIGLRVYSSFI